MKRLMIRKKKSKVGMIPGRGGFNELLERGERGHLAKRHRVECSLCINISRIIAEKGFRDVMKKYIIPERSLDLKYSYLECGKPIK